MQQFNDSGRNEPVKLIDYILDIERLEGVKASIQVDIREKKLAAHAAGFEIRALNQMLRERKMAPAERDEWDAICQLMRAELGMLGDTPLGTAARQRFERAYRPEMPPETGQDKPGQAEGENPDSSNPNKETSATGQPRAAGKAQRAAPPAPTPEEIAAQRKAELDEAAEKGREAARMFAKTKEHKYGILSNPYVAMDPRRAAWDSAYCQETGSDGMDLPPHLRRAEKPKGKPGRPKKSKDGDKDGEQ